MVGASAATVAPGPLGKKLSPIQSRKIRVIVADDTQMGCNLLKSVITRSRFRFEVVACATSRSEVVRCLNAHSVDVALVSGDLLEGPLVGFEVVREIRSSFPKISSVLLLKSPTNEMVVTAFRNGAKGVFCREEPLPALWKCIRSVYEGQIWANTSVKQLQSFPRCSDQRATCPRRELLKIGLFLKHKEKKEVVSLVAAGHTNKADCQ